MNDYEIDNRTITFLEVDTFAIHDFIHNNEIDQFACINVGYRLVNLSTSYMPHLQRIYPNFPKQIA